MHTHTHTYTLCTHALTHSQTCAENTLFIPHTPMKKHVHVHSILEEEEKEPRAAGADPGGVRWVRTNPPSSLQYQLLLRAELILGCKHSKKSGELNRRWLADAQVDGPCDGPLV